MMITVTRINGVEFAINAELIELVESTPDTVITLTNGKKYVVREPLVEIVQKVINYRQEVNMPLAKSAVIDHNKTAC